MPNVKSVEFVGLEETYDLEVEHPDHQFYLDNGILTSNSHATAYAIDSYLCAFLAHYHTDQWVIAHLEANSSNDESRAKAFGEVRALGYKIVPLDIMHASKSWQVLPGKRLMPSFLSCKGIGAAAVDELESLKPFNTLEELLWDQDGHWRLSKFNKRVLEALIDVRAMDNLNCVGEGNLFRNYKHLHTVLIENMGEIKKSTKKEPGIGKRRFFELIKEHENVDDYTRQERIMLQLKHFGSIDVESLVPDSVVSKLDDRGVRNVDEYDGKETYWFLIASMTPKTSKNGRKYCILEGVGRSGKRHKIFMWSWDGKTLYEPYTAVFAELASSDFGLSTSQYKIQRLKV